MEPNDYQIGGNHYQKSGAIQHWDLMCEFNVPYVLGCATKYIDRWREKQPILSLRKSLHYLAKAEDAGLKCPLPRAWEFGNRRTNYIQRMGLFANGQRIEDGEITRDIMMNRFRDAREKIEALIRQAEMEEACRRG